MERLWFIIRQTLKFKIMSATEDKMKGNWNQVKGKLKQQYGELTEDDLAYERGKEDETLGRIQQKTGESKENIKRFIDNA
jgi:uncharacterized protein YjbJ (UPF0337 family)